MKKTKALPTALILILISFSLISCQSQPLFDKNKTETADEINFEEVAGGEPLFYGMSEENFYDVTDFCVKSFNESGDSGEFNPLVQFSYVPYELRKWDGTMAYFHNYLLDNSS